jgi:hypothetical protein
MAEKITLAITRHAESQKGHERKLRQTPPPKGGTTNSGTPAHEPALIDD